MLAQAYQGVAQERDSFARIPVVVDVAAGFDEIAPGTYDLVSATRIGGATGWNGTRAVSLAVSEDQSGGVTFNWAGAEAGGETDRWTATFTEAPQPRAQA